MYRFSLISGRSGTIDCQGRRPVTSQSIPAPLAFRSPAPRERFRPGILAPSLPQRKRGSRRPIQPGIQERTLLPREHKNKRHVRTGLCSSCAVRCFQRTPDTFRALAKNPCQRLHRAVFKRASIERLELFCLGTARPSGEDVPARRGPPRRNRIVERMNETKVRLGQKRSRKTIVIFITDPNARSEMARWCREGREDQTELSPPAKRPVAEL